MYNYLARSEELEVDGDSSHSREGGLGHVGPALQSGGVERLIHDGDGQKQDQKQDKRLKSDWLTDSDGKLSFELGERIGKCTYQFQ